MECMEHQNGLKWNVQNTEMDRNKCKEQKMNRSGTYRTPKWIEMERIKHQNGPQWNIQNTKMDRNGTYRTPK